MTNRSSAPSIREVLGEKNVSVIHWQLLGKNIVPKMLRTITNGKVSNDGSYMVYAMDSWLVDHEDIILFNIHENFEKRLFLGLSTINGTQHWAHWILSNNSKFIVYEQNGDFYLYTVATAERKSIFTSNNTTIKQVKISPDDTKIIVCYSNDTIKIYDITTHDCVVIPSPARGNIVTQTLISADNNF